LAEYY